MSGSRYWPIIREIVTWRALLVLLINIREGRQAAIYPSIRTRIGMTALSYRARSSRRRSASAYALPATFSHVAIRGRGPPLQGP